MCFYVLYLLEYALILCAFLVPGALRGQQKVSDALGLEF